MDIESDKTPASTTVTPESNTVTPASTTDNTPASTTDNTPASNTVTPASTTDNTPASTTDNTPASTTDNTPASTTDNTPASTTEPPTIELTYEEKRKKEQMEYNEGRKKKLMELKEAINNNIKLVEDNKYPPLDFESVLTNNALESFGITVYKKDPKYDTLIKGFKYVFVTQPDSGIQPYAVSFICEQFDNTKKKCIYDITKYKETSEKAGTIEYNDNSYYITDNSKITFISLFAVAPPENKATIPDKPKKKGLFGMFSAGKKPKSQRKSNKKRKQQKSKKQRKSRK